MRKKKKRSRSRRRARSGKAERESVGAVEGRRKSADEHSQNAAARNRAISAAVCRVHAVIAQHEILILATNDQLVLHLSTGVGRRAWCQIRLSQFLAVQIDIAFLQINGIPG